MTVFEVFVKFTFLQLDVLETKILSTDDIPIKKKVLILITIRMAVSDDLQTFQVRGHDE